MLRILWLILCWVVLVGCEQDTPSAAGVAEQAEPSTPPGELTYNRFCFSCHAAGIAGAPKTGDVQAWEARLAKGRAALLQSTIVGIAPGMPPKGLCAQCTEAELAAAIDYMLPAQ